MKNGPRTVRPAVGWELTGVSLLFRAGTHAIDELEQSDPLAASIFRLRFINGLDVETVAEIHGIAPRTVYDDLTVAKGKLRRALNRA